VREILGRESQQRIGMAFHRDAWRAERANNGEDFLRKRGTCERGAELVARGTRGGAARARDRGWAG
jgi:hypothetical protein